MRIDVNAFLGAYPFRHVPGTSVDAVLASMDRVGIDEAWVSHMPSFFWRDPAAGNRWLYETTEQHDRLRPIPAVHPGLANWQDVLNDAVGRQVPAIRCDPGYYGVAPTGPEMRVLAAACGAVRVPLMMAVRLEDGRQRHPNDAAPELPAAAVRALIRSDEDVRIIVTHADAGLVQEVHWGSTPAEQRRLWWDISWIWGPPEDHLQTLFETVGEERLLFGTGQPLRIPEAAVAKLDLLQIPRERRERIESGNAMEVRRT